MLNVTPRTREGQRTEVAEEVCGAVSSASEEKNLRRTTHTNIRRSKHNTLKKRRGGNTYET